MQHEPQTGYDFVYVCTEPVTLQGHEDHIDPTGSARRRFVISCLVHEFHRKYAQDHLGIQFPRPGKEEVLRLDQAEAIKIWKAMRTHGKVVIKGYVEAFFPESLALADYVWQSRDLFRQAGEIHIHRYCSVRERSEWHSIVSISESLYHMYRKTRGWKEL